MFKSYKIYLLLTVIALSAYFAPGFIYPAGQQAHAQKIGDIAEEGLKFIDLGDNNRTMINLLFNPRAPKFGQNCGKYPGFINKIVQCVTRMVTQEQVLKRLFVINGQFLGLANMMLMLYVMNFGLKLAFMQVRNIRSEVMVVLLTCFFITYVNNSLRIEHYMRFFIGFQNEFANAATTAISNRPNKQGEDEKICYYQKNAKGEIMKDNIGRNIVFNTWQRIDCMIAYVIGIHPIVEKMGQAFTSRGENATASNHNQKFNYELFAGPENPFANMAVDGFDFLQGIEPGDVVNDPAGSLEKYTTKPRPIANNKYQVSVSFSMIVIMVGMFFTDPSLGSIAMITGFFIIFLMITAFGEAVLVYITSLFAVVVLALIAPLMIPMFLFRQTRQMFEIWLQQIFVYTIQPGIMLVYISFMIFVLQYVVTYSKCIDPNKPETCEVESLKQMHFGDSYVKAFKDKVNALFFVSDTSGKQDKNTKSLGDSSMGAGTNAPGVQAPDKTMNMSTLGFTNDDFNADIMIDQMAKMGAQTYGVQGTGLNVNETNAQTTTFNVPGFQFFTGELSGFSGKTSLQGIMTKIFANYESQSNNLNQSYMNLSANMTNFTDAQYIAIVQQLKQDPAFADLPLDIKPQDLMLRVEREMQKRSFGKKINYIHNLLVVLLTLAITFAFMNNVMTIAGTMASAGSNPVNKMFNLYEFQAAKINNFMKK